MKLNNICQDIYFKNSRRPAFTIEIYNYINKENHFMPLVSKIYTIRREIKSLFKKKYFGDNEKFLIL